ncbi:MAG: HlyD family secretion protein [Alphaproteobacteria bacterium]
MPIEATPQYQQAKAQLDKAQLDFSHVDVAAPRDGTVANVNVRAGDFSAIGLPEFSLLDSTHLWIEANFKETDLTRVRAGQPVTIAVDTYPGKTWHGTVASLTPATGNEFSLLPAENSSGNWVKVVQRLMVKVEFTDYDGKPPLASGMSSTVDIDTGANRLHRMFGGK